MEVGETLDMRRPALLVAGVTSALLWLTGCAGADSTGIVCDNYEWTVDNGQTPRHPWADDQTQSPTPTAQCNDGAVINDGGGNYTTCENGQWRSVRPTYDPNSADGYGPNQPLPPLCVRFPDQYTC